MQLSESGFPLLSKNFPAVLQRFQGRLHVGTAHFPQPQQFIFLKVLIDIKKSLRILSDHEFEHGSEIVANQNCRIQMTKVCVVAQLSEVEKPVCGGNFVKIDRRVNPQLVA